MDTLFTKKRLSPWRWLWRFIIMIVVLVIAFVAYVLYQGHSTKKALTAVTLPPGQLHDVGGYRLHMYCAGHGSPTVVMEAGGSDFSLTWRNIQDKLARETRVCSYDRAGLGWSERHPDALRSSELMLAEFEKLLAAAQVEGDLVLVGHSFGGMLVRRYAHEHADRVKGMVLVDAAYELISDRTKAIYEGINEASLAELATVSTLQQLGLLALSPEEIPDPGMPETLLSQYRSVLATTDHVNGMQDELSHMAENYERLVDAHLIRMGEMPLVVISASDNSLPQLSEDDNFHLNAEWQSFQRRLATLSANSRHIKVPNSDHYLHLQHPDIVVNAVKSMLPDS
ncbi:alpha/beta fold hydrolase [Thaumasiovibrio subtropicus]|uniref:alpha/beta fold hydrolase n=1 Tax=Thaumasiovibrio subtropicus TaxID=1891207 RepID=UPI000B3540B4|nr:alpha/beta hydrolase [Thaumasiovibrio subtropicus]